MLCFALQTMHDGLLKSPVAINQSVTNSERETSFIALLFIPP